MSSRYPRIAARADRYNRAMTDLILTPIIAAALADKPRRTPGGGGAKKAPHNFVAQARKRKAGAPLGNCNAAARDAQSVDRRVPQVRVQATLAQANALADLALAVARQSDAARRMIAAAVAEGRHV